MGSLVQQAAIRRALGRRFCYTDDMSSLSFGVIADCQYADKEDSDVVVAGSYHVYYNRPRQSVEKLREAVETLNTHDLQFVVHLGDFTDKGLEHYDRLAEVTENLKAPLWHVLGNHEYWGVEGDEPRVLKTYGLKSPYYSNVIDNFRFIVLDTNELGVMKYVEGTDEWQKGRVFVDRMKAEGAVNAYDWNGGVDEVQLVWLKQELNQAKINNQRVIVFAHHPVFPPGVLNALNSDALLELFGRYDNIAAFINGHNHCGAFGVKNTVPYITIPGMVQTETNAFGVVTVDDDKLAIKGYGRVQDIAYC